MNLMKGEKEGLKHGLKLPQDFSLTETEKEILHLITDEFLTIKQIAQRRDCSIQAVYKILRSLKKKGAIDKGLNRFKNLVSTYSQTDIRLHGQEIHINLIWQNPKYQLLLNKSNFLSLDSNSIKLYKNSLEIYLGQSFYGKTINEADSKSLDYLLRFILRLEHDLGVCLIKKGSRNIKVVNQHYARGDSEISKNAEDNKERVWIYAEEDGKLAYITDNSFGFKEDETVHPITAKPDRKAIDKQVNDWRLNNPPTNSQLAQFGAENSQGLKITLESVNTLVNQQKDLPDVIKGLKKEIHSHLKLIQEYRKENIKQRKKREREVLETKSKEQRKLSKWF